MFFKSSIGLLQTAAKNISWWRWCSLRYCLTTWSTRSPVSVSVRISSPPPHRHRRSSKIKAVAVCSSQRLRWARCDLCEWITILGAQRQASGLISRLFCPWSSKQQSGQRNSRLCSDIYTYISVYFRINYYKMSNLCLFHAITLSFLARFNVFTELSGISFFFPVKDNTWKQKIGSIHNKQSGPSKERRNACVLGMRNMQ